MKIILASGSPRRKEILTMLGLKYDIVKSDIDENIAPDKPENYAKSLSRLKALNVAEKLGHPQDTLIIAADTIVCINDRILGKPTNRDDAQQMLRYLSGKAHRVITSITLYYNKAVCNDCAITTVNFDEISNIQLQRYLDTDEPYDKAGAYAIQGKASIWIKSIDGCYFNVVGFPINLFKNMLVDMNINIL